MTPVEGSEVDHALVRLPRSRVLRIHFAAVDEERGSTAGDDDGPLFAGDSPRWRESEVKHGSELQRRRDDAPAPTNDAAGAIERNDEATNPEA